MCEHIFSTINLIKNKYRPVLTDEQLKNLILLGSLQIDHNTKFTEASLTTSNLK
jgi:hypothetical protein